MQQQRHLVCITFSPENPLTNFYTVIQSDPENTLFLYNENVEQFLDKEDVTPGGGNGVMRMYRFDNPRNITISSGSLGIPTMYLKYSVVNDSHRFTQLLGYIHLAFDQIHNFLLNNPRIQNILWTGDEQLMLGMSIATKSGRISDNQARAIQEVVRGHVVALMQRYNLGLLFYGGSNTSLNSHDFIKLLRPKNLQVLLP